MSCSLKKLDYFGFEGAPKFIGGKQKSIVGVAGTILLLAIVLGYIGSSLERFLNAPPQVSLTQSPALGKEHKMVQSCFTLPKLNNPKYFAYQIVQISLDAGGNKISNQTVPLTHNVTKKKGDEDKFCIQGSLDGWGLRSTCQPGLCSYIKIKLWTCGSPDANNPLRNSTDCAPFKDIENILQTNYLSVAFKTVLGTVLLDCAPKTSCSALYRTFMALNETIQMPDLARRFTKETTYKLVHQRNSYSVQYFFDTDTEHAKNPYLLPYKEVLELRIELAQHVLQTTLNRQSSLDLVSLWSAFFSAISGALGLIFAAYNRERFYELHPSWENIDGNFEVEKGSETQVQNEARKLLETQQQLVTANNSFAPVHYSNNNSNRASVSANAAQLYQSNNNNHSHGQNSQPSTPNHETYGMLA